ncbi:MAG: TonB-dependent receptor plug domain-containing protein [Thermoanaerobaculia bacterium]
MIAAETRGFVHRARRVPARAWFWLAVPAFLAVAIPFPASAQTTLSLDGVVLAPTGDPVSGASVGIDGREPVVTDENGRFSIAAEAGERELRVTHPAYQMVRYPITVGEESLELELRFEAATSVEETITVIGIRAGDEVPVTKRNLDREEIETLSYGQDIPALLQYTPAMTWYSDSGVGSNYSYFSMRGIQQSRINMTFDGAPLNDPAEHAVYFNNFHDFANTVDSIQIQRGVGTSSVGSPSYGGSVNFASGPASPARDGDLRLVLGSYETKRASVAYESGVFDNGIAVSGRFSYADTDGYRDNSGTKQRTLFFNTGWQGERSSLKLVSFFGNVETQLAFLAVDPETLRQNRRFNPLDEEERDDFGQNFAQLQYTRAFGDDTLLTASLYYNGADGWFRLWDDPETKTELLQFGIDQAFVGSMVTVSKSSDRLSTTLGVHYNDFAGDHSLDAEESRIYDNTGFKQTANAFAKIEYRLGHWLLFGDLQLRWAEFSYDGDIDLGSVDWAFFDPKIGARRVVSPQMSVYASLGRAQREPSRTDLLLGEDNATVPHDLEAVQPEEVLDFEVGVDLNTPRMALQANLYAMEFTNEIALTGELSEIGLPLRQNVDDSYRRGFELDLEWMVASNWSLIHSANLSRNRISEWTQFYDVYDEQGAWIGSEPITYGDVPPLLTPDVVINLGAEWAWRETSVALMGRYVADSHLDNTGLDEFRLPAYTNLDLRASVGLGRLWSAAQPKITLFVNNLLDNKDQYPSGYSYQFINRNTGGVDTLDGIPFYYPLATRNVVVSLELDL